MPIYGGQHRQSGAKIGAYRSNIEQQGRKHLLQRIPGGGDAVGERAAHPIGKISAAVAAQMIEQVELGFGLVHENGAVAEPAAGTPQHALTGQQGGEHRERPPDCRNMLRAASHRIDDQLQAILRYASERSRAED